MKMGASRAQLRQRGIFEPQRPDVQLDLELEANNLEQRRQANMAENRAVLEALGLVEAKAQLGLVEGDAQLCAKAVAEPALAPRRVTKLSSVRSSRTREGEKLRGVVELTKEQVLRDGKEAFGARVAIYSQYRLHHSEAYRGAWFYGVVVGAEHVESVSERSLRIKFDVYQDEDSEEWQEWPACLGKPEEVRNLAAKDAPPWRLAPEQMPGGGASSPLGYELPCGVACPEGCGVRLMGSSTGCERCGSVVRGADNGGGEVWLPAEGLSQVRSTRSSTQISREEAATEALLDKMFMSEWAEKDEHMRAAHEAQVRRARKSRKALPGEYQPPPSLIDKHEGSEEEEDRLRREERADPSVRFSLSLESDSEDDDGKPQTADSVRERIEVERTKRRTAQQYVNECFAHLRTVKSYFPPEVVAARLQSLQQLAEVLRDFDIQCNVPKEAEDVVVEMSFSDAGRFVELLATSEDFVRRVKAVRSTMGVKGEISAVVARAKEELLRSKEMTAAAAAGGARQSVGAVLTKVLDTLRDWFPTWGSLSTFLKPRQGVPNAENGDSARNGTNVKWQGMTVDGVIVAKHKIPTELSVDDVVKLLADSRTHDVSDEQKEWRKQLQKQKGVLTPAQRRWVERLIGELKSLETVEEAKARSMQEYGDERLVSSDEHATLLAFPFALGCQDKEQASDYEKALGDGARLASLVQEAMMGSAQREFPSQLLNAWQLRGTAWTTATGISKDAAGAATSAADESAAGKKREEMARLLAEFEERLTKVGAEAMGFSPGQQGQLEVELVRASMNRFMLPHGDGEDYLDEDEFWDGIACLLSCSAGGPPGADGALQLLGKALEDGAAQPPQSGEAAKLQGIRKRKEKQDAPSRGARVIDFMLSAWNALGKDVGTMSQKLYSMVKVEARKDGTLALVRTKNQIHGANSASWRRVVILYKTLAVAAILRALGKALPMLCEQDVVCRALTLSVLQLFVLANTGVETHQLRTQGLWKPTDSKHEGDKVYRLYDAHCDVALFERTDELKQELLRLRATAESVRQSGEAEMMASVLENMFLACGPESILRPVARLIIELTSAGGNGITREAFANIISDRVWTMRVGHAITHMDAKCSRFLAFAEALREVAKKEGFTQEEELIAYLQWAHAAYPVASRYREHISEDPERAGSKPKLSVWLRKGASEEKRRIVAAMAKASEELQAEANGNSMALQRHGISGCGFITKESSRAVSIAGRKDGSGDELSLIATLGSRGAALLHQLYEQLPVQQRKGKRKATAAAPAAVTKGHSPPARELLKKVMQHKDVAGGGGLITQRVMALSEPTGLFEDVLEAYMPGGAGSHKALIFVAALLGLDPTKNDVHAVLNALKRRLEIRDDRGDTRLAARLRALAKEHAVLREHEDLCALLGSTLLTGGALETMLCDVIWRLYRPLRLGCEKPRAKKWCAETSGVQHGGNPLDRVPIFSAGGVVRVYNIHAYLKAWAKWRDGAQGASSAKPRVEDFERVK